MLVHLLSMTSFHPNHLLTHNEIYQKIEITEFHLSAPQQVYILAKYLMGDKRII